MAKISEMPNQEIIDGFKGTLDYYYWMGIPCVRKWPTIPPYPRSPAEIATQTAFTWAASNWKNLTQPVQEAFNYMARNTPLTGKDIFIKSYLSTSHISII